MDTAGGVHCIWRDDDPQAVVGCRVAGVSLAGADVNMGVTNTGTHVVDHVLLLKPQGRAEEHVFN